MHLPWKPPSTDTAVYEAANPTLTVEPDRKGYEWGIPLGGTTQFNPGSTHSPVNRQDLLQSLYDAYLACPWASACVDTIARTIVAGGIELTKDSDNEGDVDKDGNDKPPPAVLALRHLLKFVNPYDDMKQLVRSTIVDMLLFGDGYIEIVKVAGIPVALYPLDAPSMSTIADEHGKISQYVQTLDGQRVAFFEPDEVIHVSLDAPRGGLFGVSPMQKAQLAITTWLFTAATLKETMRKGDPPHIHVDMPSALSTGDTQKWVDQHMVRNVGPRNIGRPVMTRGGATISNLQPGKIADYVNTLNEARDEILSVFGCPPSKVTIIDSGNIGGGSGEAQDKSFHYNTCQPIAGLLLEKLQYSLVTVGFGIEGWSLKFPLVDWRDTQTIVAEREADLRSGRMTLNAQRKLMNQPSVPGGDDAVLVDRQNLLLWSDFAALSKAIVAKTMAPANLAGSTVDLSNDDTPAKDTIIQHDPKALPAPSPKDLAAGNPVSPVPPATPEMDDMAIKLAESWDYRRKAIRKQHLKQMPSVSELVGV